MLHGTEKVYLIHGWAANRHVFDDWRGRLPAEWHIEAVDLPGHGGAPFDAPFDLSRAANALAAKISTPAHLFGWSLGGLLALITAARHPEKVRSLCLTASFAKFLAAPDYPEGLAQPALAKMVGLFQADYAKYMKQFLQLQLLNAPDAAEIVARVLPDVAKLGAPAALQSALEAAEAADARPLLAQIHCPVLLVYGGKDAITPPRMGEYLHRYLPHSRLLILDKAAHAPFLSHADEFAAHYRRFIEEAV